VTLHQYSLFEEPGLGESQEFLTENLITYIGNKRALLGPIDKALQLVREELGESKLRTMDAFSGSGVVARLFKQYSSVVVANDLEKYSRVINECFLSNQGDVNLEKLGALVETLNNEARSSSCPEGFIRRLYSPKDADDIQPGERVFFTPQNAALIDNYRRLISEQDAEIQPFLLAPLLSQASIHTNTAGVFKGFYKDVKTGIGKFGGSGGHALDRICGEIRLKIPRLSNYESEKLVLSCDVREAVERVHDLDLVYLDPPYNQHPYGSNYFMLNLITDYVEPTEVSEVSGIPYAWNRSPFNKRPMAASVLAEVIARVDARYVLISYNSEGFISPDDMRAMLQSFGDIREMQTQYNTYRGSRNLSSREKYVVEHLYLVRKGG
jgi:adenine-specific DNA-methyltransferase